MTGQDGPDCDRDVNIVRRSAPMRRTTAARSVQWTDRWTSGANPTPLAPPPNKGSDLLADGSQIKQVSDGKRQHAGAEHSRHNELAAGWHRKHPQRSLLNAGAADPPGGDQKDRVA